jgi:hypothetical protein
VSLRRFQVLCSLFLCGIAAGCGDGRPARVPVSGKVLIDGKPLTFGAVRFTPVEGRPATGELDADGLFSLSTFESGDGAVPGAHAVTVHPAEQLSGDRVRWHAPKKYESVTTSGISLVIDEPTDSVVIELTWGEEKGPFVEKSLWGE